MFASFCGSQMSSGFTNFVDLGYYFLLSAILAYVEKISSLLFSSLIERLEEFSAMYNKLQYCRASLA